ncbi:hypothetical protein L7F22_034769 [Adiantum nelumboides]|nr:hypothetical protein [Adiantum nelumboides]
MSERYNNLWCSVSGETLNLNGTSLNPVLREVVTPSNPSVEVTSSNPSLGDEITPSDSSLENDTVSREPSCDELNEDFVAEDMLNQETNQNLFSIYDRITEVIIELQTLCDENQASKAFQDRMLIILFGGMGGSHVGRDDTQEEKASLSKLLVQLPSTWDGSLGDVFVPACWDQLNAMFTTLGMVESSRYRVCQGSQDNMHSPILYPPSLEDNYSGNVVRCECNAIQKATRKLKRDCKECCEKCTICGISRKQMMCFDYISIEHQLKCLTRSQSICHEFLEMWRNKKRWLDNSCISEDTKIHEFWDGTKCKNFEDFWNPNSHFELPVICPNSECKQAYRAWPTPDNALQARSTKYKVLCKSCREEFECDKVLCKGDPRNFALLVHWDGFQSSKTTQKNCGVVEVKILNTGKESENINVVRTLLASWRVRTEELLGPNSAPLEHVAGVGEILDDILRHGSHDVIWCYLYERMVSIYVRVKTNHKDEEMTLVNYFRRLLFTWVFAHLQADRDRLLPTKRIYRRVHQSLIAPEGYLVDKERWLQCPPWHELGVLKVTSIEKEKSLWGFFTRGYFTRSLCLNMLIQKGIVVGGKKTSYREATDEERRFCTDYLHKEVTEVEIHDKVFLKGEIYRAGDNVVVLCDEQSRPTKNVGHWKACIQHFFSLEHNGSIQLFFGAIYYRQMVYSVQEKDYLQIDNTTGMSILQSRVMPYTWDCIRPIESLLHKFIPLQHGNHIIAYETKDLELRQRLIEPGCVGCIPPWIEENDIVQMKSNLNTWCSTSGLQFVVVRAVDQRLRQVKVAWIKEIETPLREEKCSLSKEEETNDVTKLEASTFPMPIIDEEEEQKKDHMETDKFLMDIKGFEGLQQYKDEDDDNLDHDLEISYTELLQNGLSKRVQATKELSPCDETPMLESYEEMACPRKSGRKRKLSEKMKKYCEVDNAHIKESNASGEVTKRSKEKSNDIEVDVNTLSHEDMETIVLVHSKKKTIMDMYFCLRKMYIGLKEEESSFRSYSKESKSPDSETMIKQVVMWLLHMEKSDCTRMLSY